MINKMLNIISVLLVLMVFVIAGCNEQQKAEVNALDQGPDVNSIVVTNGYTPRAIKVTGGYEAWMKVKKLDADCVVTFYNPDGSYYLTEQRHEIYPWSGSIKVSAAEPLGEFVWQLSEDKFTVLKGAEQIDLLPIIICDRSIAAAVLDITTAPVRFMDTSAEFTEGPRPVRKQGLWYHTIEKAVDAKLGLAKVVFYQSKDNSLVDMIWFAAIDEKNSFAVRAYDYRDVAKQGVLIPDKIEIFKTDTAGVIKERIIKIDYN